MKLCTDCKYHTPNKAPEYALCGRIVSPVHGGAAEFCEFERRKTGECKPEALHFEPKPAPQPKLGWRFWA